MGGLLLLLLLEDYCRPMSPCVTDGGLMLTKTNTCPCCLRMIKGLISAYHVIRSCWDVSLQPYTARESLFSLEIIEQTKIPIKQSLQ